MTEQTFHRDLARGKQVERWILGMIKQKYPSAFMPKNYVKEFDIAIPELDMTIEVKADEKSKYTGNLVVEIEFDGEPSALATTTADWWVWWDGKSIAWITPELIWRCIEDNRLSPVSFVGKGDVKKKKAFLIKKDRLYQYAHTIVEPKNIPTWDSDNG